MPGWNTVVIDDSARSQAEAKLRLLAAREADRPRAVRYALRYDGGKYVVIRRDPRV